MFSSQMSVQKYLRKGLHVKYLSYFKLSFLEKDISTSGSVDSRSNCTLFTVWSESTLPAKCQLTAFNNLEGAEF